MRDRWGAIGVLVAGVFCFLVAYLGFAVSVPSIALLAASFVVAGLAIGCIENSEHAAVAALAPVDLHGSAFGLLATVQSFGNLVASGLAGLLWSLVSPTIAFLYLAAWAGLACMILTRVTVAPRPPGTGER
jgi:predicted MFS family arabinose efflux permease